MSKWAPNGLILVHVKVVIFLEQVNQLDVFNYLILGMGKRAKTFIVAFFDIGGVKLAKFCLIPIWMIQLLQFIMRKLTRLIVAFLFCTNKMIVLNV